jgi:integrase
LVVTFDEMPRTILWNDENRNLEEMQPRARYSPTTDDGTSLDWEAFVPKWLGWVGTYRAVKTRESYEPRVRLVLGRIGKRDLRKIQYPDVEGCLADLVSESEKGVWKPSTRNGYVAALRSFWRYLIDKLDLDELGVRDIGRKLDTIPSETVNREKTQYPPPTKEEYEAIVRFAETHGEEEWAVAARYLWTSISRISDLWTLRWSQLDLGPRPKAFLRKPSKHGSNLTKLLDPGLAKRLLALKDLRRPNPDDPVFAKPGEPEKSFKSRFNRHLKTNAAKAGIGKYLHPHLIRAAARTHAIGLEVPEHFLDRQGGWSVRSASDAYSREDPETWRKWVTYLALD